MLPKKKVQTNFPSHYNAASTQQIKLEDENDSDFLNANDSHDESPKKTRKRRTLGETGKRDFICGCGKSYVSYPAIYLHVQRKHNGEWQKNTIIPEKTDNQDKVKRGRPKKEKDNTLDIYKNFNDEIKYKVEDDFWIFLGTKGNADNQKAENKFIKFLEAISFNPIDVFQPQLIFSDPKLYHHIYSVMKILSQKNPDNNQEPKIKEENALTGYDQRLSSFLLWTSNPLKEDIFIELGAILFLLRTIIVCTIWTDSQKDFLGLKGNILELKANPKNIVLQLTNEDSRLMTSLIECGICPFIGSKWIEIKKQSGGAILNQIISEVENNHLYEPLFFEKLQSFETKFESKGKIVFKNLANSLLCLKETEIREESPLKKKWSFLSYNTMEDLTELLQKLCSWLQYFNEEELKLKEIDWGL